jgi:endonuclease YncB( thermonuclease family)
VSKHWTPRRQTVELRPSRIRREPERLPTAAPPRSREADIRNAVIGVAAVALVSAALVVGVSEVTSKRATAAAPEQVVFGQCHTAGGPDCVLDGNSFYLAGERIDVAGITVPDIRGAACPAERTRGIEAAVTLGELLNRGVVTRAADSGAGTERQVQVDGRDVAALMIAAGVARETTAANRGWCEAASDGS